MNRCFEATVLSIERLEQFGLFRQEFLNSYRVTLEYTRSRANDEMMDTLRNLEQDDTARFERMHDAWEKQNRDPDDVFFHAQERREEIKEHMRPCNRPCVASVHGRKTGKPYRWSRNAGSVIRLFQLGLDLAPGHRALMHGEDRIHFQVCALYGMDHFVHQLGIIERVVVVQNQGITGVEQMMLGKVDHVLALG